MRKTNLLAAVITIVPLLFTNAAGAADLMLFGGGHFEASGKPLAEAFTKKTGIVTIYTPGVTGGKALPKRLNDGEKMDVIVMNREDMDNQVKAGLIKADSVVNFARDRYGIGVLKGAPKPDVSTVEKFRAALLAAKAVGMQDPDPAHHSGIVTHQMLVQMGIADQMQKKIVSLTDQTSALLAGKVDFIFWPLPEILEQPKLTLAGPVPGELGGYLTHAVGILTRSQNDVAAKALIKFITSPDGAAVWSQHGLEPL